MDKWMSRVAAFTALFSLAGALLLTYQYVIYKEEINASAKSELEEITSVAVS